MYTSRSRNTVASKTIIVLLGILLNFVLFFVSSRWKLPFSLDTTGTAYVALLLGPIPALIVGLIHSLILVIFFSGPSTLWFYSISVLIAFVVGVSAEERILRGFSSICGVTFILYLLCTSLSSVLTVLFLGGQLRDYYGAMIFNALTSGGIASGLSIVVATGATQLPDVILTAFLVAALYLCTPSGCKKN